MTKYFCATDDSPCFLDPDDIHDSIEEVKKEISEYEEGDLRNSLKIYKITVEEIHE